MYVAICGPKGKESVSIREDYRPDGQERKKTRVIRNLGPLRKLLAEDPEAIQKLRKAVRKGTETLRLQDLYMVPSSGRLLESHEDGYSKVPIGEALLRKAWKDTGLGSLMLPDAISAIMGRKKIIGSDWSHPAVCSDSLLAECSLSEAVCIDISGCLYLIDMNGLPLSCSRYDGTSRGMLQAISSMRKDLMVGSLIVIPPSSLSSEDSLALIADEGYGFIAGGSWLRDIGTGPYTCKARIHLQDGEIRRTGRAGAPRRYRISSVPSMVFDSGYPLITDIPGIGKEEAFRIYGMKEQLEEDAASINTDSLPLMFACLTAMRYIQYSMGRRIPVRDAIEGAEAIILGTDDQRFYGICATDLYLKASRALGMPALRKTMTQSMMDAYMEAGDA